jgi:hypothetical protein
MSFDAAEGTYDQIEARLMSHGVYVTDLDPGGESDPLEVTYETVLATEGVPNQDVGRLLNVLLAMREEGWEPERIEATAMDAEGNFLGTWHAEAEWFERLEADDLTEIEFSQRVLDTIETD